MRISKSTLIVCFIFFIFFAHLTFSIFYLDYFYSALDAGEYSGFNGFARFVIPDTFLYKGILQADNQDLAVLIAAVKNSAGPMFIWFLTDFNWFSVVIFNSILILLSLLVLSSLCKELGLSKERTFIAITVAGLMPALSFYSVGALKELPTLFLLTSIYLFFVQKKFKLLISFSVMLFVFRYQMFIVLLLFYLLNKFSNNPFRASIMLMLLVSSFYPFFAKLGILSSEAAEAFREVAEGGGGALVENVRNEVPLISSIAVFLRVIQSVFEPFFTVLSMGIYEGDEISVMNSVYVVSLALMAYAWIAFFVGAVRVFLGAKIVSDNLNSLFCLIFVFVVPTGGFSFIHHRYMFPISFLVILASVTSFGRICISPKKNNDQTNTSKTLSGVS